MRRRDLASRRRDAEFERIVRSLLALSIAAAMGAAVALGLHGIQASLRPSPATVAYVEPDAVEAEARMPDVAASGPDVVGPVGRDALDVDASPPTSSGLTASTYTDVPPAPDVSRGSAFPSVADEDVRPVPLPVARPSNLTPGRPSRETPRGMPPVAVGAAPVPETSIFERIFGSFRSPAALPGERPARQVAVTPRGTGVAVYDISARTLTLPGGERLEAHSGLGERMDDPRHSSVRMKGPTPPGSYDLTEREALFHGVRAIRLNPVGGAASVHGRSGLLAHTYMLGPRGDSNGCLSIRNYERFLQAYLTGEVSRLVVVDRQG